LLQSLQVLRSDLAVRWGHLQASAFFSSPLNQLQLHHVVQGEVFDAPLLAAIAGLIQAKKLGSLLVPPRVFDSTDPEDEPPDPDLRTFKFHSWDPDLQVERVRRIDVTSMVPVEKASNLPVGASLYEESGWIALIEKAYAQFLGGYDKLHAALWTCDVLYTLTGVRATTLELQCAHPMCATFEDMQELLQRSCGTVMVVCSQRPPAQAPTVTSPPNAASASSPAALGAVLSPRPSDYGQCYTVLSLRTVPDSTGVPLNLVELWSPWPQRQQLLQFESTDTMPDERGEDVPLTVTVPLLTPRLTQSWVAFCELEARWGAATLELEKVAARAPGVLVIPWEVLVAHEEFQQLCYCSM
jgi:hypothetical protein